MAPADQRSVCCAILPVRSERRIRVGSLQAVFSWRRSTRRAQSRKRRLAHFSRTLPFVLEMWRTLQHFCWTLWCNGHFGAGALFHQCRSVLVPDCLDTIHFTILCVLLVVAACYLGHLKKLWLIDWLIECEFYREMTPSVQCAHICTHSISHYCSKPTNTTAAAAEVQWRQNLPREYSYTEYCCEAVTLILLNGK